ncbi:DUF1456 family protein [Ursidibacter arcticus]
MFNYFTLMTNNEIFNHLLFLTGLNRDDEKLVELFLAQGIKANKSKVRAWRRKVEHPAAKAVPDDVLRSLFRILFDEKNKNIEFCEYPN